jgi:hypothetical protein
MGKGDFNAAAALVVQLVGLAVFVYLIGGVFLPAILEAAAAIQAAGGGVGS